VVGAGYVRSRSDPRPFLAVFFDPPGDHHGLSSQPLPSNVKAPALNWYAAFFTSPSQPFCPAGYSSDLPRLAIVATRARGCGTEGAGPASCPAVPATTPDDGSTPSTTTRLNPSRPSAQRAIRLEPFPQSIGAGSSRSDYRRGETG
jgi:hypothetical protein